MGNPKVKIIFSGQFFSWETWAGENSIATNSLSWRWAKSRRGMNQIQGITESIQVCLRRRLFPIFSRLKKGQWHSASSFSEKKKSKNPFPPLSQTRKWPQFSLRLMSEEEEEGAVFPLLFSSPLILLGKKGKEEVVSFFNVTILSLLAPPPPPPPE